MSNIIDSIRMSGTTYAISDSGGTKVVEITQSDYDNLPTSAKTANIMYVITDAEPFDVSNYYTKAETSGATELATAFAATQPKLSAGTNITIDANNVISAEGGGGGIDSGTVQTMIDQSISGKTNQTDFVSHSGNTSIHVTTAQTAAWDAKSDFSGSYNDLTDKPTIPIVPTNVSSFNNDAGYITSNDISGKTNQSDFVSHSGNTTMHVTASEKSTWNAKSDFSGNYNDLSNKPTIPTSASQLTNDSGYITSSALNGYATEAYVTAATNDMATKTWVGQQGYLTQHQDISGKQDVSGMTAYTETSAFTAHTADTAIHVTAQDKTNWNAKSDFSGDYNDLTNKLSAGTNITIVDNVISATGGGGGKAVSGGRYITVTSGETADTVSFNLEIGNLNNNNHSLALNGWIYGTGSTTNSNTESGKVYGTVFLGGYNTNEGYNGGSSETDNMFVGSNNKIKNTYGSNTDYNLGYNVVIGRYNNITGYKLQNSVAIGYYNSGTTSYSLTCGYYNKTYNVRETSFGSYNNSVSASTTFGNSGNTLFSVGNGSGLNNKHNAFEIKQNGDIYVPNTDDTSTANWYQKPMVRLQDTITALGGLKLVKLTQSEYDNLSTKDNSTLYVIVN